MILITVHQCHSGIYLRLASLRSSQGFPTRSNGPIGRNCLCFFHFAHHQWQDLLPSPGLGGHCGRTAWWWPIGICWILVGTNPSSCSYSSQRIGSHFHQGVKLLIFSKSTKKTFIKHGHPLGSSIWWAKITIIKCDSRLRVWWWRSWWCIYLIMGSDMQNERFPILQSTWKCIMRSHGPLVKSHIAHVCSDFGQDRT